MSSNEKSSVSEQGDLPYFQQLQMQFAQHIRNPQIPYAPEQEASIEPRRLNAYKELFFNNVNGFFSNLFPVCKQILGEARWTDLIREYLIKHHARTPLFHEMGEEFIIFLNEEYEPLETDPEFLLELAHYEWMELAVAVSPEEGFAFSETGEPVAATQPITADALDAIYELSPVAWPLAYQWPVHLLSVDNQPTEPGNENGAITTLMVYRNPDDSVGFMELTPLLFQWLLAIEEGAETQQTAAEALHELTADLGYDAQELEAFALQSLQQLLDLYLIRPLKAA
ncbi:MAG: putative DNA-binding domain-containing protein [Thiotrichales bacterium]|nr:putative DNA-binding domain-containing protein [Thiotrichales bacterium]